ncbi:MAG: hypothetical protein WC798_02350 [Candidatus Paceibacterota bacterium]
MSPAKTSATFAVLIGGIHVMWSAFVALGWAQPSMDFIFRLHMVSLDFVVQPFDAATALILVAITAIIGALFGYCMAIIWNRLHRA